MNKSATKTKKTLISFVGLNDRGKLINKPDGAILTVFKELRFDTIHLLWNQSKEYNMFETAEYIKTELIKRGLFKPSNVFIHFFDCKNVTDHNEIYPKLLNFCKSLPSGFEYTSAIASGTPAMQVCWIMIAESGDFSLKLIRSNEPKFGKPYVSKILLDTNLPRIIRLKEERKILIKDKLKERPQLILNIKKRDISLSNESINLSPVEFAYYRYFIERAYSESEFLDVDITTVPEDFYNKILKYHREAFPQADANRQSAEILKGISTSTFRSNVSKLNKKIQLTLTDKSILSFYQISSIGSRFYKKYGLDLPKEKINIIK